MVFRDWQAQYAAHGVATFPVRVGDDGKTPAIRGWQRVGLPGSAKLGQQFADADAFGFCPGRGTGLTILDVDSNDECALADTLDRHGPTPIIVRSGSGNYQAWYRWHGERRRIRPDPDTPIDILGSGFVVAPPSHGTNSTYQFIEGGLHDLDRLPHLRDLPSDIAGPAHLATPLANERTSEGARNKTLWQHCMRAAHHCDNFDSLLDVAGTRNQEFLPPLPEAEVIKVAQSAWGYTQRGENHFGRPGVFFEANEATDLICSDSDAFLLLAYLHANNGPTKTFMIANGLAKQLGWTRKRLAGSRRRLEGTYIKMVQRPSTFKGPALYRWVTKGGQN
jgi:bifunctional DNA primase/polymerase-like protein/primase-like protein